jgi:hypothetical protein
MENKYAGTKKGNMLRYNNTMILNVNYWNKANYDYHT